MGRAVRHILGEIVDGLWLVVMLIGWPAALLMLARKVGPGGLVLGLALLGTNILMAARGEDIDGQA